MTVEQGQVVELLHCRRHCDEHLRWEMILLSEFRPSWRSFCIFLSVPNASSVPSSKATSLPAVGDDRSAVLTGVGIGAGQESASATGYRPGWTGDDPRRDLESGEQDGDGRQSARD